MLGEQFMLFSILVVVSGSFECYTGRIVTGYSGTTGIFDDMDCTNGIHYCLKVVTPNQDGGLVIEKSCDTNGLCTSIGNRCNMDLNSKVETCCCSGEKCNSASSLTASIFSMSVLLFLIV